MLLERWSGIAPRSVSSVVRFSTPREGYPDMAQSAFTGDHASLMPMVLDLPVSDVSTPQHRLWDPSKPIAFTSPAHDGLKDRTWHPSQPIVFAGPSPSHNRTCRRSFQTSADRRALPLKQFKAVSASARTPSLQGQMQNIQKVKDIRQRIQEAEAATALKAKLKAEAEWEAKERKRRLAVAAKLRERTDHEKIVDRIQEEIQTLLDRAHERRNWTSREIAHLDNLVSEVVQEFKASK
ncbi:hypothetical protein EJ06DRAFT_28774 [Trichodelitschia bisporula]|uniref:Uncharacterized protein n=1 Tax=Trichodelitschia bisporula TaxID=703511 RepID=A0A6G1IB27_9PEZI|nr:hypothetical protein EJ06DRAFT_28774 [Trichodelitschia bisporula]